MSDCAPRLTGVRAAAALADLELAAVAAGVVARRRPPQHLLERAQLDGRAVTRLQTLRREFGSGPVELVLPGRRVAVVLDPADVTRVLQGAQTPFHPANAEKIKALQWFQPHGVLLSRGPIRERRRTVNEATLDFGAPLHRLAAPFSSVVAEEMGELVRHALDGGRLDSAQYMTAWWRVVRRVVAGRRARDDDALTDDLWRLRSAGNWSFLALPHRRRRDRFFDRLYSYAEDPDPDSLLGALAEVPAGGAVDPVGQVPQWMFAFDSAGMASLRALALLATHPEQHALALRECRDPDGPHLRQYLRACVLESVRLWPTTPSIVRDTTAVTEWGREQRRFPIDPGTAMLIVTGAFHRDDELLPFADSFVPDIWLDGTAQQYPQLQPFSSGPAACPGQDLVLFTSSTALAVLLSSGDYALRSTPDLTPRQPLPATFSHLLIEFDASPVTAAARSR